MGDGWTTVRYGRQRGRRPVYAWGNGRGGGSRGRMAGAPPPSYWREDFFPKTEPYPNPNPLTSDLWRQREEKCRSPDLCLSIVAPLNRQSRVKFPVELHFVKLSHQPVQSSSNHLAKVKVKVETLTDAV